jgi:hypothetical protein
MLAILSKLLLQIRCKLNNELTMSLVRIIVGVSIVVLVAGMVIGAVNILIHV